MQTKLPKRTVVLLGIGHTNAHVLRMWRMKPIDDAQLICISNTWTATYSGMLPGVLADQYPVERMEIDLVRLCASAGARLIVGNVTGLDLSNQRIQFQDRPELPYDALSIGIGSVPTMTGVEVQGEDALLPIKPMQTFLPRLQNKLDQLDQIRGDDPVRIAIVGSGAGGTEFALCLPSRLKKWFGDRPFEISLVNSQPQLVSGGLPKASKLVEQELAHRGVRIVTGQRVRQADATGITLANDQRLDVDVTIWATGAAAPQLLSQLGLPTDDRGFLLTQDDLRVVGDHPIFAVGDTGTNKTNPTLKAGVFAVRQGPVLWRNIARILKGQPLDDYKPQRNFLTLLNLGDGRAIAQYKGKVAMGRWCWWLKDYIDGKFMDKYQDYTPMKMKWEAPAEETLMRCTGCGGKVGGTILSRVLARLDVPQNEHVLVGLDQPDDAAIIQSPNGRPMSVTTDFFAAPLDDPYIVGRIAALNATSDVFALGAKPLAALTIATIPIGSPRQQEQVMYESLAGSLHEFRKTNTSLVGGHTIEGATLTLGFTVLADQGTEPAKLKGNLRVGDRLLLTKPLGSGILLAGHMQALCEAAWMKELLETMLLSNQLAASLLERMEIHALTDVTGFGLAGHLLEMLKPSNLSATLSLSSIPLISGTGELLRQGIESTLSPANRDAEIAVSVPEKLRSEPAYSALFDPQTCGGLLMGVAEDRVETLLNAIRQQSDVTAAVIGQVTASDDTSSIKIDP